MPTIMYNGKEYPISVPYKELQGTLTAGQTSITFTDSVINSNRVIDYYPSIYEAIPTSITITSGSVVFTFEEQETDMTLKVRVS
jgi:hypothetical protein